MASKTTKSFSTKVRERADLQHERLDGGQRFDAALLAAPDACVAFKVTE